MKFRSDYELNVAFALNDSMQQFNLRTAYFNLSKRELYNSIRLLLDSLANMGGRVLYIEVLNPDNVIQRDVNELFNLPEPVYSSRKEARYENY